LKDAMAEESKEEEALKEKLEKKKDED